MTGKDPYEMNNLIRNKDMDKIGLKLRDEFIKQAGENQWVTGTFKKTTGKKN